MQFSGSAVIEKPIGNVCVLLDFNESDATADCVHGSRRDVEPIASANWSPINQLPE
jgi:hypothetical protein